MRVFQKKEGGIVQLIDKERMEDWIVKKEDYQKTV